MPLFPSSRWSAQAALQAVCLAAACAVTLLAVGGCARRHAGDAALRIGLMAPLSGDLAEIGSAALEGARLAVGEANRDGGLLIAGKRMRVELLPRDCGNSAELAVSAAQDLFNREDINALVGPPFSGLAIPVARLADKARVPMVAQVATHPDVTRGTRWVFRACFTDDFQGKVLARFTRETIGARTAAILYDVAGAYNTGVAQIFSRTFQELGGTIVAMETYTTGERDFHASLGRVKAANPDVLLLPNYVDELRVQIDQVHEMGIRARIVGCDSMEFREPADIARLEGAYVSTHFSAEVDTERVRRFVADYKKAYQREPGPLGALTYDAVQLILRAAAVRASPDSAEIREGLSRMKRFEGVTGDMDFNGSPDPKKSVVIITVEHGRYRLFARIDPQPEPADAVEAPAG